MQPIDELIDSALKSERLREAPQGFHGRVMERISAEAIQQGRATANLRRLVRPVLFMGVLVAAVTVVPIYAFYDQWTRQFLPGGMGLLDYAAAWIDLSRMSSLSDFTFAAASAVAAGVAVLGGAWGFSRIRGARSQAER